MRPAPLSIESATSVLRQGGIVAYPTEGVWGLGCDPFNATAVQRLLRIKNRPATKGMIVIAADFSQALPHLLWDSLSDDRRATVLASWPGANTWLIPCRDEVPDWLRGDHHTLAVRVTSHPVAAALCRGFGGLLVSTSANRAGEPAPHHVEEISDGLLASLDGWVAGETDGRGTPSVIRDARSGRVLRGA